MEPLRLEESKPLQFFLYWKEKEEAKLFRISTIIIKRNGSVFLDVLSRVQNYESFLLCPGRRDVLSVN
jgi:5-formyltetrahydrofolate cyclo-ligase